MYYNYNDNELLYLAKEGIEKGKELLYYKYEKMINMMYFKGFKSDYSFWDFKQECLLLLNKVIYSYNNEMDVSFYLYFNVCLKRLFSKMYRKNDIRLKESQTIYADIDSFKAYDYNQLRNIINRTFSSEEPLVKLVLHKCYFEKMTIRQFCRNYQENYYKIYYIYQKIKAKIEKILTN